MVGYFNKLSRYYKPCLQDRLEGAFGVCVCVYVYVLLAVLGLNPTPCMFWVNTAALSYSTLALEGAKVHSKEKGAFKDDAKPGQSRWRPHPWEGEMCFL